METPDLWTSRVASSLRERVPQLHRQADGTEAWVLDGKVLLAGHAARAAAFMRDRNSEPRRWDEVPPPAYVPAERLKAMDAAGVTADDLDLFVPHQANMRITDAMFRALKLPDRVKVARDIAHQGNSSAASIPLAIEAMTEAGEAKSGDTALIIGFGAGLVYAAQVIVLP